MTSSTSPVAPAHINDAHKPIPHHINDNTPTSTPTPDTVDSVPTSLPSPPPYIDPALLSALVYQLDYYFSPANLYTDTFLLSQMDATRAVPVATIASFRKIQQLTTDIHTVTAAMQHCANLVLDVSASSVRPASISNVQRTTVVLRDVPSEVEEAEVTAIFSRAGSPGQPVSVYCDTLGEWSCVMDSDDVCVDAALWLTSQSLRDQPIKARVKSDATKPTHTTQPDVVHGYMPYQYNPYAPPHMYGNGMMDYHHGPVYGNAMYNPYLTQQPGMPYMPPHSNGVDYHIPLPASAHQPAKKGEGAESGEVQPAPGTGKKSKKKKSKAAKAAAAAAAAVTALAAVTAATAASTVPAATSVSAPVTPSAAAISSTSVTVTAPASVASAAVSAASPAPSTESPATSSATFASHNIPFIAPSSYASKSEQYRPVSVFNNLSTSSIVTAAAFPPISSTSAASASSHVHSIATAISAPTSPATFASSASHVASIPSAATAAPSSTSAGVKAPVLLNYASKVGSMSAAEVAKVTAAAKAAREAKLKADMNQPHTQQDKTVEDNSTTQPTTNSNKENTHFENAPTPSRPSSATVHREGVWVKKDTSNNGVAMNGTSGASTSPSWRERSREYPKRIHAPHPQRFAGYAGRQFGHAGQSPASSTSASSTASSSSSPSSPSSSSSSGLSVSTPTPEAKRPFSYAELIKRTASASISPSPTAPATNSSGKAVAAHFGTGNGPVSPLRPINTYIPPLHPPSVSVGHSLSTGAPVSPAGSSVSI